MEKGVRASFMTAPDLLATCEAPSLPIAIWPTLENSKLLGWTWASTARLPGRAVPTLEPPLSRPAAHRLACEMSDLDEHLRVPDSNVRIHADPDGAGVAAVWQEMLDRMTFERFTGERRRTPLEAALDFARSYAERAGRCSPALTGGGVAGERVKAGYPAYFVMAPDLLDHLRRQPRQRVSYDRLFEQVKNTPLLVLDHLGTQARLPGRRRSCTNS